MTSVDWFGERTKPAKPTGYKCAYCGKEILQRPVDMGGEFYCNHACLAGAIKKSGNN